MRTSDNNKRFTLITNAEIKQLRSIVEGTVAEELTKKLHSSYNAVCIAYNSQKNEIAMKKIYEKENLDLKEKLRKLETKINLYKKRMEEKC